MSEGPKWDPKEAARWDALEREALERDLPGFKALAVAVARYRSAAAGVLTLDPSDPEVLTRFEWEQLDQAHRDLKTAAQRVWEDLKQRQEGR